MGWHSQVPPDKMVVVICGHTSGCRMLSHPLSSHLLTSPATKVTGTSHSVSINGTSSLQGTHHTDSFLTKLLPHQWPVCQPLRV